MVKLARDEGAEVLLVGVPKPGLLLTGVADLYEAVSEDMAGAAGGRGSGRDPR